MSALSDDEIREVSRALAGPITLTPEQAAAIGKVLESADGYCTVCAADLADEMAKVAPGHDWRALVRDDEPMWGDDS